MDHNRRDNGHRSTFNRKRRYRDEDEGYDRRNKRRYYEEPAHTKLRRQLLGLADSPLTKHEDDVRSIALVVADAAEDEQLRSIFLETILQLVVEQPLKIPFLGAVAVATNVSNKDLVRQLIGKTCNELTRYMRDGCWRAAKLLLRLLACMQPILTDEGIFPILDELFARAADLQTASAEDSLGLELVKIILLTVAYTMKVVGITQHDRAMAILEKTEIIASAPHNLDVLVNPFVVDESDSAVECKSIIGLLQQQLQHEASRSWALQCLPRLATYVDPSNRHTLPVVIVPTNVSSGMVPLLPEVFVSVYSGQDIETVPSEDSIASTLIRDVLVDTINSLHFNRNAAAKALIDIDCYFTEDTFVKRATAFDKLKEIEPGNSTWKPEDVVIDAVFSQLLLLPLPEQKPVYYHSVLTEACKLAPAAVAPSLGRAIRFLYNNMIMADLEIAYRFIDWFAHHLSNFGFTWKWTEWTEDLELPMTHPKKAFIIGALDKEIRLSFAQRIRGTLPEQYLPLVPESKDKDIPDYKYNSDDVPYSQHAHKILHVIRSKGPDSAVQEHINAIEREAVERLAADPVVVSTDVLVTCICYAGAKSLSHVLNCIERCKERLLTLTSSSESARCQIIDSVMEYWRERPGVGVNIIGKLLNYTILSPMSVIDWAFVVRLKKGEHLANTYLYEMVAGTVDKVSRRIRQVVTAKMQHGLATRQVEALDQALSVESGQLKQLYTVLEDALNGVADGIKDEMVESNEEEGKPDEMLLRAWGQRWLKTFRRKLAVEQAWLAEMASRPLPALERESMDQTMSNGSSNAKG